MTTRWTQQEIDDLRRLYPTTTAIKLSERLGRSKQSIHLKAFKLGLKKRQPSKITLTNSQELWLKRNFSDMRNEICATHLEVSVRTLVRMARRLGLNKSSEFMTQSQLYSARKACESHLRNGTYPPKGFIIPKSELYRFKPRHKFQRT